jgi:hypothetical protein
MSQMGQKRTWPHFQSMSALCQKETFSNTKAPAVGVSEMLNAGWEMVQAHHAQYSRAFAVQTR